MSELTGTEALTAPIAWVGQNLTDAGFLASCLPDAIVTESTAERARFQVKPKLALMSGTIEIELSRLSHTDTAAAFELIATAAGAGSTLDIQLNWQADAGTSNVVWQATHREIRGMLKMVPKTVLHAMMRPIIADVWQAIRAKLPPA